MSYRFVFSVFFYRISHKKKRLAVLMNSEPLFMSVSIVEYA